MRKNIWLGAAAYYNRNPRPWARRRNSETDLFHPPSLVRAAMHPAMHPLYDDLFALRDHVVDFYESVGKGRHVAMIALPYNLTERIGWDSRFTWQSAAANCWTTC